MKDSMPLGLPKFTIFLPVFNGQNYIEEAVRSVLSQSYRNWNLVILDNNSTDETLQRIQSVPSDDRISVLGFETSLPIWGNWNRIFEYIKSGGVVGSYMTVVGHDDIFYPGFLEAINGCIEKYPDASIYQTHFDLIDAQGGVLRECQPMASIETYEDFFAFRARGLRDSFGTGYVFKPSDYLKIGGIPNLPSLLFSDDLMVIGLTRLSYKVCAAHVEFAYRLHATSTSGIKSKNRVIDYVKAFKGYVDLIVLEYPDLLKNPYLCKSLAYMIYKNVELFNSPILRPMFDQESREALASLLMTKKALPGNSSFDGYRGGSLLKRRITPFLRTLSYLPCYFS